MTDERNIAAQEPAVEESTAGDPAPAELEPEEALAQDAAAEAPEDEAPEGDEPDWKDIALRKAAELENVRKQTAQRVQKASRKLARQYRPDRNPGDEKAEERFKEVQAAYDIVGDPEKRKQYDRGSLFGMGGGTAGAPGTGPGFGFDVGGFGDILSNLFGG